NELSLQLLEQLQHSTKMQPLLRQARLDVQQLKTPGRVAAKNILNDLANKPREDFVYLDKGIMATIGRQKAVVQVKDVHVTGTIAWLMWLFVHVFYLIGFKNRFSVMFQWAWSYFTYKRGSRLITEKNWH
ncbi:MAG: hypothetical protein V4736_09495, partial [Bdellovibrionota bacterium]